MGQICQVVQALMLAGEGRSKAPGRVFLLTQMAEKETPCRGLCCLHKGTNEAKKAGIALREAHQDLLWGSICQDLCLLRALAVGYAGDDAP